MAPGATARRAVDVHLAGDASAVDAMESVLRERVATAERRVAFDAVPTVDPVAVVTPGPTSDTQLARVWIDLRGDARLTVYIVDGAWERVLVRHLARPANPEVAFEEIGHIVELALDALTLGERIGIGRDAARAELLADEGRLAGGPPAIAAPPPSRDAPPPPLPAAPRSRNRFDAGLFYAMTGYSGPLELATGPGIVVDVHHALGRVAIGGAISAQYMFPSLADARSASVRFESGSAFALGSARLALAPRDELDLGLGFGAQLDHAVAEGPPPPGVRFSGGSNGVVPAGRVLVRYRHGLPAFAVFAGLGVDVPTRTTRYVLAGGGEPLVLFEPWGARPFVLAGVALR